MSDRDYEQKLKDYINSRAIRAEHVTFAERCHTVEEAAVAAGTAPENIIKSICMLTPDNHLVVAVVMGPDRVSTKKVARVLGTGRPRMATPEEIMDLTGYPCGGTPCFGFEAQFIVDEAVMERDVVFAGGGSEYSLTRIPTAEILRVTNALVARVRK